MRLEVLSSLPAKVFYKESNAEVYRTLNQLVSESIEIDENIVSSKVSPETKEHLTSFVFGARKIVDKKTLKSYMSQLTEAYKSRVSLDITQKFRSAIEWGDSSIETLLEKYGSEIFNLTIEGDGKSWFSAGDLLAELKVDYEKRKEEQSNLVGFKTGIEELDEVTKGFVRRELTIIGGTSHSGKTTLAIQLALANLRNKHGVAFFSFDTEKIRLTQRFIAIMSGIEPYKLMIGMVPQSQQKQFEKAEEEFMSFRESITITDIPLTLESVVVMAKLAKMQNPDLAIIIIDYLMQIDNVDEYAEVSKAIKVLRSLAKELDIAVVVLSQLSKFNREDKRPTMDDLKMSGQIRDDAFLIILLYNEWLHNKSDQSKKNKFEAIVAKNKGGGTTDTVYLTLNPKTVEFESANEV